MASFLLKNKKISLDSTEHSVIRQLRPLELNGAALLLAVSGGLDSMALVRLMIRIQRVLEVEIAVAHVHHGPVGGLRGKFRREAWQRVGNEAHHQGLAFFSNVLPKDRKKSPWSYEWQQKPAKVLRSEQDLRDFRFCQLDQWRQQLAKRSGKTTYLVTAHHRDDQFETRMIRLIRGTGLQGLSAMSIRDGNVLRPLLHLTRKQMESYAKRHRVKWEEDPSNVQLDPLRNWLRHEWLPALESRREGGVESFARSLETILSQDSVWKPEQVLGSQGLDRQRYLELSRERKKEAVAAYLRCLGVKGYGQGHVEEIVKRLDSSRRELKFTVLKWNWIINAEQINAFRSEGEPGNN